MRRIYLTTMKSNTKRNLFIGFGISLLLLLISSLASYTSIRHLLDSGKLVNHTDSVIQNLEMVLSSMKDAETGQRGYLLTGQENFLEPFNGAAEREKSGLQLVKFLTLDNPEQQQSCEQLQGYVAQRQLILEKLIKAKRDKQETDITSLEEGKKYMDQMRALVKTMEEREQLLLVSRNAGVEVYATYAPMLVLFAGLLSLVITIILFLRVNSNNNELVFQNNEKEKRAGELVIANKELVFQSEEKEKRAAELVIANRELVFQNKDKEKRAAELVVANEELVYQNDEKEKRAAELAVANEELVYQNNEKEKRAAELAVANEELVFQNNEKEKRAAELVVANEELVFQNNEKENRASELVVANRELLFQNDEKEKRAAELVIAIDKRALFQQELENKDVEITRRINMLQNMADKIAGGNYAIRIDDDQKDGLGSLAISLNKMTESLQYSFGVLSDKEWLQSGISGLNDKMSGEKDLNRIADNVIRFVSEYTNSQVGAFYLLQNELLTLESGYAFEQSNKRNTIKSGEGIVGQCAATGKEMVISDIPAGNISVSYAAGEIKPRNIIVTPVFYENNVIGVIETATVNDYDKNIQGFLKAVSGQVGIMINSAQIRGKLEELLNETQAQGEELQVQQNVLEELNTDLETKTESLQASEEELKVQQEELQQANGELEERTILLEEKNQLIVERNLDIQKKSEELMVSTKYKSEFLANMSHELRTPLNSILLLSRLLSDNSEKNLSNDQVESAKVIQSSGNGLLSLIDEILDLSKIESGKMDIEYSNIDVGHIVDDMRSLFAPIARERNLELKMSVSPSVPHFIETDKMRLEQVLKNLLSNALKFTAKGYVSMHISIPEGNDQLVKFSVTDTGIGILKEKQGLVFEAFQQADGSTKRKYGGTGLGLSISRELVKLLGGQIQLHSEPGEGSEFIVTIPIMKNSAPLPYTEQNEAAIQKAGNNGFEEIMLETRKEHIAPLIPAEIGDDRAGIVTGDKVVLIVEDDTNFAGSLLTFARRNGYKGIVVVRGDQALQFAIKYMPIAILLDIQLPVMDGWQAMEQLKGDPKTRHIPVHIMSSMSAKKESLQSGAVEFIDKPVALEQMKEMFLKLDDSLSRHPKKVLIVEENKQHAEALGYFLGSFNINAEIQNNIKGCIASLKKKEVDCVVLDMGLPGRNAYETLETIKKTEGLEDLPIIIFTGKQLSRSEESKIKQYADSIILKTAHSYQRVIDEVGLFLHLIEENRKPVSPEHRYKKLGALDEVLNSKKVLVADDDVRNIFSLTKALEQHNMKVLSATDGKEAIEILNANPDIDVVLMDIMMPEMDGYESIKKIRQQGKFKRLPILAVTAKAMMGDREKCITAGASDYISKPVDIDQLLSLLRVWLYNNAGKQS